MVIILLKSLYQRFLNEGKTNSAIHTVFSAFPQNNMEGLQLMFYSYQHQLYNTTLSCY